MAEEIKSTARIDELIQKGMTEGLSTPEKDELISLLKASGMIFIPAHQFHDGGKDVH